VLIIPSSWGSQLGGHLHAITHLNGILPERGPLRLSRTPYWIRVWGARGFWPWAKLGPWGGRPGHGCPTAHQCPLRFSPILLVGCGMVHPSTYIKGPLEESLHKWIEGVPTRALLSSPLPYAPHPFLSSFWLSSHVWSRASKLEDTPHTRCSHATGILVHTLLLPLLCWT
jgi:hypothetical protein